MGFEESHLRYVLCIFRGTGVTPNFRYFFLKEGPSGWASVMV